MRFQCNFPEDGEVANLLNSTQLKFIENGSGMAKGIQYIKTTQMINVNENLKKTIKQTIKTVANKSL